MENAESHRSRTRTSIRDVASASTIGTVLEWYDFYIAGVGVVTLPLFGALSDRVGRRPLYIGGAVFLALFAFPLFWLLNTEQPVLIWLAIVLGLSIGINLMFGPQGAFLSEIFPTRTRYSGIVLAREIPSAIVGGTAPFVATALIGWSGGGTWPISVYIIVVSVVICISAQILPETFRKDLSEPERERQIIAQET